MTNTRKADALDWDWIETKCADDDLSTTHFRALIELRDRVEALEAQHAHADVTRLSDAERDQFYAELAKPVTEWLPSTALLHGGSPAASTEARPGGLVKRVAKICAREWDGNPEMWEGVAEAAIREVAAWLDGQLEIGAAHLLREEVENG